MLKYFYQVREKLEETGRLWWSNSDITVAYMLYAEDHFSHVTSFFSFPLFLVCNHLGSLFLLITSFNNTEEPDLDRLTFGGV